MEKQKNKGRQEFKLTAEYTVPNIRNDSAFLVPEREWIRLKKQVKNLSGGTNLWEIVMSVCLSLSPAFFSTLLYFQNGSKPWLIYYSLGLGTAIIFAVSLVVVISKRKEVKNNKTSILDKMDEIESFSDVEENGREENISDKNEMESPQTEAIWATKRTALAQGGNFRQLLINNTLFSSIKFTIQSNSDYWRAGCKFCSPNSQETPPLLTKQSFLLHLAMTNGKLELYAYIDGNPTPIVRKDISQLYKAGKPIEVVIERNDKNFIFCYVNDSVEYNGRLEADYYKKLYMCTWADNKPYEVEMDKIEYTSVD